MVQHQETKYNWKFVWMGVGPKAEEIYKGIQTNQAATRSYDANGIGAQTMFADVTRSVAYVRAGGDIYQHHLAAGQN